MKRRDVESDFSDNFRNTLDVATIGNEEIQIVHTVP